jgi:hypothetical protein
VRSIHLRQFCIGVTVCFVIVACVFSSCEKCDLEGQYTVAVSDARVTDMHGPLWNGYTSADLKTEVMSQLRAQFGNSSNLILVTGPADIHIFIDSLHTDSYEWDESRDDPCYGEHGWLYQTIFPPDVHTYRLHETELIITYTVVDSLHLKTGWGRANGLSKEGLSQPTGDSTQCFQYEVAGSYDPEQTISGAVHFAFSNFRCEIHKMME